MICNIIGATPGVLTINIADCHIYSNHITEVRQQMTRPPRKWPTLKIKGNHSSLDDFKSDDFVLEDYYPHDAIKAKCAA